MKNLVLRSLSPEIEQLIDEKATSEKLSHSKAVAQILADVAIERAIQHDVALLESWLTEAPDEEADGRALARGSARLVDGARST